MPAALPVDWTAIEQLYIAGMKAPEIAARFRLWRIDKETGEPLLKDGQPVPDTTAIRARACRYQWPGPHAIRERATKRIAEARKEAQALQASLMQPIQAQHTSTLPFPSAQDPQIATQETHTGCSLPSPNSDTDAPSAPTTAPNSPSPSTLSTLAAPNCLTQNQTQHTQNQTDTVPSTSQTGIATLSQKGISLEIAAEKLARLAEAHPLTMADYVAKKRDAMVKLDTLPVPRSWREANQLDHIARRNMGIEKAESSNVQVNVGVWDSNAKVKEWTGGEYDV